MEGNYYACFYKSRAPKNDSFVYDKLILHHVKKIMVTDDSLGERKNIDYAEIKVIKSVNSVVDSGKNERWIFHKMYSNGESTGRGKVVYCLDVIDEDSK